MTREVELAENLVAVRSRIALASEAAGRAADDVQLTVVTKTFPASDVAILASLGVTDVAENRDQEARAKANEVSDVPLRWHMIGQLQRKKTTSVASWAQIVESVDRETLVVALANAAAASGRILGCLVQVCLDPVPGRGGAMPIDVPALCDLVAKAPELRLDGLMAVAPFPGDPDEAFARLAIVRAEVMRSHPQAHILSAGMSGDLEAAVRHGATQVRVGGAILGRRPVVT